MTATPVTPFPSIAPGHLARVLALATEDLDRVRVSLNGAADVEWVSDLAALYRLRLDGLARLVDGVAARAEAARLAVKNLERLG